MALPSPPRTGSPAPGVLVRFVRDLFTGPDGETYAIGRIYTVPVMLVGLAYPFVPLMGDRRELPSLTELGAYFPLLAGAVTLLIAGNNKVDNEQSSPSAPQQLPAPQPRVQ